jgi:hypothetical protein
VRDEMEIWVALLIVDRNDFFNLTDGLTRMS